MWLFCSAKSTNKIESLQKGFFDSYLMLQRLKNARKKIGGKKDSNRTKVNIDFAKAITNLKVTSATKLFFVIK